MQRFGRYPWVVAICVALTAVAAAPTTGPSTGIEVGGEVGKPRTWTAGAMRSELATHVRMLEYTTHGQKHASAAVPLLAVLKASGLSADLKMDPKADPDRKNLPLRLVVVAQGRDGYTASFALAELLADIGQKEVWVCLDLDGKPLPDGDGPARLVVPSDAKPGRWVHAIAKLSVVDPVTTTQPAK